MEENIFQLLAKAQSVDEIKSYVRLLRVKDIRDKAEIIVKKEGQNLNENKDVFAYKDENLIINYASEKDQIIVSFKDDKNYSIALKSDKHSIDYLDCANLYKNLHKVQDKFNNLNY